MPKLVVHDRTVGCGIAGSNLIPRATLTDTVLTALEVFLPTVAKGAIVRRPAVMSLAGRLDIDRRAKQRMQRLRRKYGTGPLLLHIMGRRVALLFAPVDVNRVLAETPEPFATATPEKTAALAHFEPKGSLISRGEERQERRSFNETVLETCQPVHRLAGAFSRTVASELGQLYGMRSRTELTWNHFAGVWFRIVRQVIFGKAARDDEGLSSVMSRLRHAANWAFLIPQNPRLRRELLNRIDAYLRIAEPESLVAAAPHIPITGVTHPEQQIPQWLFAFDAAGMAAFRTLALLASHPNEMKLAREEIATSRGEHFLPFLRAAVLDAIRLWPTTPLVLRETDTETHWRTGIMPARTTVAIFTPFFHRDDERLAYADQFSPQLWRDGDAPHRDGLIPFSEGSAACPGRELVLLLTTEVIRNLLSNTEIHLRRPCCVDKNRALPSTLNHFALRFELRPIS